MPLFKRPNHPTYIRPPAPPKVTPGDRVRIAGRNSPKLGELGTVSRVAGRSVVLELDRPYMASGTLQKLYYSYAGELELIPRVGRMGAVDLFANDEEPV
jgi:hypothetical protein